MSSYRRLFEDSQFQDKFLQLLERGVVALESIDKKLGNPTSYTESSIPSYYSQSDIFPHPSSVPSMAPQGTLSSTVNPFFDLSLSPLASSAVSTIETIKEDLAKPYESTIEDIIQLNLKKRRNSRTVKLFLSSAINDMKKEKELFYSSVLPALSSYCAGRGIQLCGCYDFSSGANGDMRGNKAIECTFQQIDECRPYFISLLGNQYGNIRSGKMEDLPLDESFTSAIYNHKGYEWLEKFTDRSIVELEVLYGALFYPGLAGDCSFFYMKGGDEGGGDAMEEEEEERNGQEEEDPGQKKMKMLKGLKRKIKESGLLVRDDWTNDDFAVRILDDLKKAVDRDFPPITDEVEIKRNFIINQFAVEKTEVYVDNVQLNSEMEKFMNAQSTTPLILTGERGTGKTSLLCKFLLNQMKEQLFLFKKVTIIPVFVQLFQNVTDIIRYILKIILSEYSSSLVDKQIPTNSSQLLVSLTEWLLAIAPLGKTVILIDSIDQLPDTNLSWLPATFPSNVRIIISCTTDSPIHKIITSTLFNWTNVKKLSPLENADKHNLGELFTKNYLSKYKKALTHNEKHELVSSPLTSSPLYYRTVLDRIFVAVSPYGLSISQGQLVLPLIQKYFRYGNIDLLYQAILADLESIKELHLTDHFTKSSMITSFSSSLSTHPSLIRLGLSLIYLSRNGLKLNELIEITKYRSFHSWAKWKEVLFGLIEEGYWGLIDFSSESFKDAVKGNFLLQPATVDSYRKLLMLYFKDQPLEDRKLEEYPYQLLKLSQQKEEMKKFLADINVFLRLYNEKGKQDLFSYWKYAEIPSTSVASFYQQSLRTLTGISDIEWARIKYKLGNFIIELEGLSTDKRPKVKETVNKDAISYLEESLEIFKQKKICTKEVVEVMLQLAGLLQSANKNKARELINQCMNLVKLIFNPEESSDYNYFTERCISIKAGIAMSEEKYDEAHQSLKELLNSDPNNPKYIKNIADLYREQRLYEKAEVLYIKSLEKNRQLYGNIHTNVVECLQSLGLIYKEKGNFNAALKYYLEVVEVNSLLVGNVDKTDTYLCLGELYQHLSNFPLALNNYEKTLSLQEKQHGATHSALIPTLTCLSQLSKKQGDLSSAISYAERAVNIAQSMIEGNTDDVTIAQLFNQLASCYVDAAKYNQAEELSLKAMAINEKILGTSHPEVAENLYALGQIEKKRGQYRIALEFQKRGLEIVTRFFGKTHPKVAQYHHDIGMTYRKLKQFDLAHKNYSKALDLQEKIFGLESAEVADTLNGLGILLKQSGHDLDLAVSYHQRALAILEKLYGPDNIKIAGSLNLLAEVYRKQGKYDYHSGTEKLYERALEINRRQLGDNHPEIAENMNGLAQVYKNQMNYDKAEPLYLRSIEITEQTQGPTHKHVLNRSKNLAEMYESAGKLPQAAVIREKIKRLSNKN